MSATNRRKRFGVLESRIAHIVIAPTPSGERRPYFGYLPGIEHEIGARVMDKRKLLAATIAAASLIMGSVSSEAQMVNPFAAMPGFPGVGGGGGGMARAIIGVAMATIIQNLSEQERQNREIALHKAATMGAASWRTSGKDGKSASYKKVGSIQAVGNQKCQKVQETITLANGERGVSEENVCFN